MGIKAINNRIQDIKNTLVDIEKEVSIGNYSTAANLTERLDRQSDELWRALWKYKESE
jgi:hypothetical protein